MQKIAKTLAIPYKDSSNSNSDWVQINGIGANVIGRQQSISDSTMPDISVLKLQDALWLCEKRGLLVSCIGKGKVVKQSIVQGAYITKGQQIQIELN